MQGEANPFTLNEFQEIWFLPQFKWRILHQSVYIDRENVFDEPLRRPFYLKKLKQMDNKWHEKQYKHKVLY